MSTKQLQRRFSQNFFDEVIHKRHKDEVEIINVDVSHVVPPGENFICELLRVHINFLKNRRESIQDVTVIAKNLIESEAVLEMDEELDMFNAEMNIYNDILPIMEELDENKNIAPKSYYISRKFKRMLVIEDLTPLNYKMGNRLDGLNLDHCLMVLEKLAYFHAASLAIYEKNPNLMDQYNKGLFYKTKSIETGISIVFEETLKTCQREPGLHKYVDKLVEDLKEKCYTSTMRDQTFNVLNHGDMWCNNLMFRYNTEGKLEDVKFVDFQLAVFASPCFDLHYFIVTSTNLEVQKNHIKTIINHYYDKLTENAKKLNVTCEIPNNKGDFYKHFCNKSYMGLSAIFFSLPLFKANKRSDSTFSNFVQSSEEGSFRHHCFNNSNYTSALQSLLELYESFGAFD